MNSTSEMRAGFPTSDDVEALLHCDHLSEFGPNNWGEFMRSDVVPRTQHLIDVCEFCGVVDHHLTQITMMCDACKKKFGVKDESTLTT